MIIEYHRPLNVEDAVRLLARPEIKTLPMGGGSVINAPTQERFAVVDLQELGLDSIVDRGSMLTIGATATLQALLEWPDLSGEIKRVIQLEASYNLRQVATAAGTLVAADGRSPFAAALLALDAQLSLLPGDEQVGSGELLLMRGDRLRGRLITHLNIPLNAKFSYQYVARTPVDLPIVSAAVALWPSGRTRLALGGYGSMPALAMDGPEAVGAENAAQSAYNNAGDEWASAEYRKEVAVTLTRRCLKDLAGS